MIIEMTILMIIVKNHNIKALVIINTKIKCISYHHKIYYINIITICATDHHFRNELIIARTHARTHHTTGSGDVAQICE